MLFNSYEFIFIFLPIMFFVYFALISQRLIVGAKSWLVLGSLFFYSWWNIAYLPLILISMLFNYVIGTSLNRSGVKLNKKSLLVFGVLSNIALLVYFKYVDFFIGNVNYLSGAKIPFLDLVLPLAISFFTFQQITYLVDSYRNETAEYDFLNYALFVVFFPQLIAGPIVHHKEMMPQFASKWNLVKAYKNIAMGVFMFAIGLFKKVVIADTFSIWVVNGFDKSGSLTLIEAWVTSLSYTFQLYFDFSGYTDMAIGVALLFNIKLPVNFNSPYKAIDIQDFWRRWHITLSRFLRDYIYIPLGGNRVSPCRASINIMITFVLGGLWHGAGWTFIFWGFLHGSALIVLRLWKKCGVQMNSFLAWLVTFNFINISWVFFRAKEWGDAIKILQGMFGFNGISLPFFVEHRFSCLRNYGVVFDGLMPAIQGGKETLLLTIIFLFVVAFGKNSNDMVLQYSATRKHLILISSIFAFAILSIAKAKTEFLYFNF